uniref:Phosphoprotein n=1 Tax=Kanyawara virus TaxID=2014931 RepID=A0A7D5AV88_9RHAB|nr:phosphoprotein [Kanyawara virus]
MEFNRSKIHSAASRLSWSAVNTNLGGLEEDAEEIILENNSSIKEEDQSACSSWANNPVIETLDEIFSEDSDTDTEKQSSSPNSKSTEDIVCKESNSTEDVIEALKKEGERQRAGRKDKRPITLMIPNISRIHNQRMLDDVIKEITNNLVEQLGFQTYPDLMEINDRSLRLYVSSDNEVATSASKVSLDSEPTTSTLSQTSPESLIDRFRTGITFQKRRGGDLKITLSSGRITESMILDCYNAAANEDDAIRAILKKANLYTTLTLLTNYK